MRKTILLVYVIFLNIYFLHAQSWSTTGNGGTNPSTNFIGTIDNKAFVFKTNNSERIRITSDGKLGIGVTSPAQKLDVNGNINIGSGFALYMTNHKVLQIDSASGNTFLGNSVAVRSTGNYNTVNGFQAFHSNTTGAHNTVNGYKALYSNTTGYYNMANGSFALYHNTTGNQNIADGYEALYTNTTGRSNIAIGHFALGLNTTGNLNTAMGDHALFSGTTGSYNMAGGASALYSNSTGSYNTANGYTALYYNTAGNYNAANGYAALYANTTGSFNTANGPEALASNTTGELNTAAGYAALYYNTGGLYNTANGAWALYNNLSGGLNVASGYQALYSNIAGNHNIAYGAYALQNNTGSDNTSIGYAALGSNTTGEENTAVGVNALPFNTDSWANTAIGYDAGYILHTGWNNTFLGSVTYANYDEIYNSTAIGNLAYVWAPNEVRIGNDVVSSIGGFADWTNISDGRVKKNIKQNVPGLAFINKLKPITYNLDLDAADKITQPLVKKDKDVKPATLSQTELKARNAKQQIVYTGFVAQDVEKAARELNYDFSGVDAAKNNKSLYGLRYSAFVVPLVKAVQELSGTINDKDKKIDSLQKQYDAQQKINANLQQQIDELKTILLSGNKNGAAAITSDKQKTINISSASLGQNTPNPFNHTTTIDYTLPPQYSSAKIIITDESGKVMKEVNVSGAGKNNVTVDASSFSSGIYQYSLYIDGRLIGTKQMVRLK